MLDPQDQQRLLRHARRAIAARLENREVEPLLPPGALGEPAAAFVTIRLGGRLRGCIGSVEADEPVHEVVARCAADAATRDPRFPPLPREALPQVCLEISVLTPFRRVADPAETVVGRHGVMVEQGPHRALLLPQVAGEWGWDRETFLSQTCVKAGLAADAWRTGATVHTFEAQVFGEA
jgi:AmmeMemoRadiSam system protein A